MKLMTVLGTRPEIIRLSTLIPRLDEHSQHVLVHTNQNFDPKLSDIFFQELGIRTPDHFIDCRSSSAIDQIGKIMVGTEGLMLRERPDRLLILGDTNSGLSAFVAKRLGIPVYHMEAGNRCFDDRVPEEVNRRVIDHSSDILMPYTERSRANLLREGIPPERTFVIGNPIKEVLEHYQKGIRNSRVLEELGLTKGGYFLVTLHRAENVDDPERLKLFVRGMNMLNEEFGIPIIWSVHPRTRSKLRSGDYHLNPGVRDIEPLGILDFVKLETNARCVLTDSGTVQEECCIFHVPNVTLRDVTERPETVEVGSNILSGAEPDSILSCVCVAIRQPRDWTPPPEYSANNVSRTVLKIVTGYS